MKIPDEIWKRYFSGLNFSPTNFVLEEVKDVKYKIVKASDREDDLNVGEDKVNKIYSRQSFLCGKEGAPYLDDDEIQTAIDKGICQEITEQICCLQNENNQAKIKQTDNGNFELTFGSKTYNIDNDEDKFTIRLATANSVLFFDKTKKEVSLYSINKEKKKEGIVSIYTLKNGIIQNTKNFFYKNGIMKNVQLHIEFDESGCVKNNYDIICKDGTKIHMHEDKINSINGEKYEKLPVKDKLPLEKLIVNHTPIQTDEEYCQDIIHTFVKEGKALSTNTDLVRFHNYYSSQLQLGKNILQIQGGIFWTNEEERRNNALYNFIINYEINNDTNNNLDTLNKRLQNIRGGKCSFCCGDW